MTFADVTNDTRLPAGSDGMVMPRSMIAETVTVPVASNWRSLSGAPLTDEVIRLRLVGRKDEPVVVALGGISAEAEVAVQDDGWWAGLAGPGRAIDTDRNLVVGATLPPTNPGAPLHLCPEDFAQLLHLALRHAEIERIDVLIGASFGGMVAQSMARLYPEMISHLVIIGAAHRPSPSAMAVRQVQREILALTEGTNREGEGVALARKLAMTTYRSSESWDDEFRENPTEEVSGFLHQEGEAFAHGFSSGRYATLSAAIDAHDEDPRNIKVPTTVIATDTDKVAPLSLMNEFAARLPKLERYELIRSTYGHDAFLAETAAVGAVLKSVLND